MLRIESVLDQTLPWLAQHPRLKRPVVTLLEHLADEQRFNDTLRRIGDVQGLAFARRALEVLSVGVHCNHAPTSAVPAQGPLLVLANHPLGMLDAMALLDAIGQARADVRVLANAVLMAFPQLREVALPVPVFGGRTDARAPLRALERGEAVLLFPAGEVSRVRANGVRDRRWSDGCVRLARMAGASVLPVHVSARNSAAFYGVAALLPPLAPAMLPRQALVRARTHIGLRFGDTLRASDLPPALSSRALAARLRRHVYRIGRGAPALFDGLAPLQVPLPPARVERALARAQVLRRYADGKCALLLPGAAHCDALREIGRLRELSFRAVGEGSGKPCDLDRFDASYEHLVLWDPAARQIAGAYRLGLGARLAGTDAAGLYCAGLFEFSAAYRARLPQVLELGRSFIAPEYWRSRALDQLWQGIGAYLQRHPQVRWLLGPVTLSAVIPKPARDLVMATYRHCFGRDGCARGLRPPQIGADACAALAAAAQSRDCEALLLWLREQLDAHGCSLPVLYRQYADLVAPAGLAVLDFSEDPLFSSCVDALIEVDLQHLRPAKRSRYLRPADAAIASD